MIRQKRGNSMVIVRVIVRVNQIANDKVYGELTLDICYWGGER